MHWKAVLLACGLAAALAGCASDDREWMKLNEKYTTADFRRDVAACTKAGKLEDACMRGKGWVAVNPSTPKEKPLDPHARDLAPSGARAR